jgi:hypothetical protein
MDMTQLQNEAQIAVMLIELGVTTVEKVKAYFASKTDDDEVLAGIMLDVDSRIARRSDPPAA